MIKRCPDTRGRRAGVRSVARLLCGQGRCFCDPGYFGPGCEHLACPGGGNCSNAGMCVNGTCQCASGYARSLCAISLSPRQSTAHGVFDRYDFRCDDG